MARTAHHEASTAANGDQAARESRGMMQPDAILDSYARFAKQMETINQQWMGSMRQTAEAGWDLASQMAGTVIADGRRMSDLYLRLCQADLSAATSAMRHLREETSSTMGRHLSAVQRQAGG